MLASEWMLVLPNLFWLNYRHIHPHCHLCERCHRTFITGQKHLANWNFLSGIKNPPCLTPSPYNHCVSLSPLYFFHNIKPFCLYVSIHSLSSVTIYNRWFRSKKGELQSSHMSPCGPTDVYTNQPLILTARLFFPPFSLPTPHLLSTLLSLSLDHSFHDIISVFLQPSFGPFAFQEWRKMKMWSGCCRAPVW